MKESPAVAARAALEDAMTDLPPSLRATPLLDFESPALGEFARRSAGPGSARDRAVRLYYAVRDGIRYDPYDFRLAPGALRASRTLEAGTGWCVPKAILLAAACRAQGIPARLGFADVRNHLATERLRELMGTDLFLWHGYVSIEIEGRAVKATPAFNIEMCRRFDVLPLEFDGSADSLLQPFNARSQRHMEYVRDRGLYDDVPEAEMAADFRATYPRLLAMAEAQGRERDRTGAFERDAIRKG